MKKKILKLITEILAIVVICLISFVGVYKQSANKMKNEVKDYKFSKNLSNYREIIFEVSDATQVQDKDGKTIGNTDRYTDETIESNSYKKTETKVNNDEDLNQENYNKAKKIIEERLKGFGVEEYNLSINKENGTIALQIPENSETDHTVSNLMQVSKFEIRDSKDSGNVFITNKELKTVSAVYNTTTSGTTVYMQIQLNKEGTKKLKELSMGEYATQEKEDDKKEEQEESKEEDENAVEDEVTAESEDGEEASDKESEENEEEKEDNQKKVALAIDYDEMITTSFDSAIEDGMIHLSMNKESSETDSINDSLKSTSTIALLLNSGEMPLTYKIVQNQYVENNTLNNIKYVFYAMALIIAIAFVVLIFKFKVRGLVATISYIGFVALDLLLVRYTNVNISIESIAAGLVVLIINYFIIWKILKIKDLDKEIEKINYKNTFKDTVIKLIPILIIAVIFTFVKLTSLATFGMFIFWGILLSIIYNYILTKDMLD